MDFTGDEESHSIPVKGGLVEELTEDRKRRSMETYPSGTRQEDSLTRYPFRAFGGTDGGRKGITGTVL